LKILDYRLKCLMGNDIIVFYLKKKKVIDILNKIFTIFEPMYYQSIVRLRFNTLLGFISLIYS
jgi:hypothetical protein